MAVYVFECPGREHDGERVFERFIPHIPKGVVQQIDCPQDGCGAVAKRRFDKEIPTQSVVGLTPISHTTTGKGSIHRTIEKAFGKFKQNPDGSVDTNHAAFRDSGELKRFLDGENNLGPPVVDDNGRPLRNKDGSVMQRRGAKLIQFGKNDTPSRDGVRRQSMKRGGVYRNGNVTAEWARPGIEREFGETR